MNRSGKRNIFKQKINILKKVLARLMKNLDIKCMLSLLSHQGSVFYGVITAGKNTDSIITITFLYSNPPFLKISYCAQITIEP
jgi:hypothetical protein